MRTPNQKLDRLQELGRLFAVLKPRREALGASLDNFDRISDGIITDLVDGMEDTARLDRDEAEQDYDWIASIRSQAVEIEAYADHLIQQSRLVEQLVVEFRAAVSS